MNAQGEAYWRGVTRVCKPLSREQEQALNEQLIEVRARLESDPDDEQAKRDSDQLREQYVHGAMRYAIKLASRYRAAAQLDDAVQEASLGLLHAFDKFDPTRGVRFLTYATWWMRAQLDALGVRSRTLVKVPRATGQILRDVAKRGVQLPREAAAVRAMQSPVWLDDEPVEPTSSALTPDVLERAIDARMMRDRVEERLTKLDPRLRDIMRRRYGLDDGEEATLQAIADVHGLSRERVRQLAKLGDQFLQSALA